VNTEKSPEAFRTISEVADWLGTPAHVLRFWESRFPQIKPVKRAGGRRYYRPADMELLGGIKKLLHDDGMTIRGVQKLLRENGVRRVADLSPPLAGDLAGDTTAAGLPEREQSVSPPTPAPPPARPLGERAGPPAPRADDTGAGDSGTGAADPEPATDRTDDAPGSFRDMRPDAPEAPMAQDLSPEEPEPAEVLPFVLSPRTRAEAPPSDAAPSETLPSDADTPDLFERVGQAPAPDLPDPGRPDARLRMPAIPPDPSDADPLPVHRPRRPVLPRRTAARPDDRLTQLFHRLAELRGRMDRPDP